MNNTTILLFTDQYPHGIDSEQAFLKYEVALLQKLFIKVVVYPKYAPEPKYNRDDIEINELIVKYIYNRSRLQILFNALLSKQLYVELLNHSVLFWTRRRIIRLLYDIGISIGLTNILERDVLSLPGKVILYSYWNNEIALSLALIAKKHDRIKALTRTHGHDLYENVYDYIPCLRMNIKYLDCIYCISRDGQNYLINKFPEYRNKIKLFYLGVEPAKVIANEKNRDLIIAVSCSYLNKLKRADLVYRGLLDYVNCFKRKVYWVHFGDGPELMNILNLIKENPNDSLHVDIKGFIKNEEVLSFYQHNYIDFFITASSSEGLPVSLQEAQAYGIPIIATAVNGIPEIVDNSNGTLLSENPSPEEISKAIDEILKRNQSELRKAALDSWKRKFDCYRNHLLFGNDLATLFS